MGTSIRTQHRVSLAVGLAMLAMLLSAPSSASASAFGCQYVGGFGFSHQGVTIQAPQGWLCHDIRGNGKVVTSETASYGAVPSLYGALTGRICNWRIDFVYRGQNNNVYRTDRGPAHANCAWTVSRNVEADKTLAYYGTACAQLYVSGVLRAKQCHNITA